MAKNPKDPKEIAPQIVGDYQDAFGDQLISIVLYGSAASGDYQAGKSDINFMIVLTDEGIESLHKAFGVVDRWRKKNVAVPLFLTREYLTGSLDVFPIEYLSMQRNHQLLYGEDCLGGLSFDPEHVRLQCEREIKGKLLLLREAFLESSGKAKSLREIADRSLPAIAAILGALLYLKGTELPAGKRAIIRTAARALELDGAVFQNLLEVKEGTLRLNKQEMQTLFQTYLKEVRKLSRVIDQWGG